MSWSGHGQADYSVLLTGPVPGGGGGGGKKEVGGMSGTPSEDGCDITQLS